MDRDASCVRAVSRVRHAPLSACEGYRVWTTWYDADSAVGPRLPIMRL